ENRYGRAYYSFEKGNDLFIVLDPNRDAWNIGGDQLIWLQQELNEKAIGATNVFVFFHQLLWWTEDNIYRKVRLNSTQGRADSINFWTEVFPLFDVLEKEVYMFAGDVGANAVGDEFFYHQNGQVHFIASGMGSITRDNFIITEVLNNGTVRFRLIGLSCAEGLDCLGALTDYELPM
ncbi:MAG: hypothetical protein AAFP02_19015, partial [Bacteroidota bacterium]